MKSRIKLMFSTVDAFSTDYKLNNENVQNYTLIMIWKVQLS